MKMLSIIQPSDIKILDYSHTYHIYLLQGKVCVSLQINTFGLWCIYIFKTLKVGAYSSFYYCEKFHKILKSVFQLNNNFIGTCNQYNWYQQLYHNNIHSKLYPMNTGLPLGKYMPCCTNLLFVFVNQFFSLVIEWWNEQHPTGSMVLDNLWRYFLFWVGKLYLQIWYNSSLGVKLYLAWN